HTQFPHNRCMSVTKAGSSELPSPLVVHRGTGRLPDVSRPQESLTLLPPDTAPRALDVPPPGGESGGAPSQWRKKAPSCSTIRNRQGRPTRRGMAKPAALHAATASGARQVIPMRESAPRVRRDGHRRATGVG